MVIPCEFWCTPGCSELLTKLGCWSGDSFYQLWIRPKVSWAFYKDVASCHCSQLLGGVD